MKTLQAWRAALALGKMDPDLQQGMAAPGDAQQMQLRRMEMQRVFDGFEQAFSSSDKEREVACFSAPGRTELIGNHTDHQLGEVLAASVNLDILAVAAPNGSSELRIQSEGWPLLRVDLAVLEPIAVERGTTAALVRGVAAELAAAGANPRGFDLYCRSSVLPGSGLSSSAAVEVLLACVATHLWGVETLGPVDWAQIGQRAENQYFGKPSGLMDQVACAVGAAVHIDFAEETRPMVEPLPLDLQSAGYALCILDSGADHADLTEAYAAIPAEMRQVAQFLGVDRLGCCPPERFFEALPRLKGQVSDRALLRAHHFYSENRRVQKAVQALRTGSIGDFLDAVQASGQSSFSYLQNIFVEGAVEHQELAVALAVCEIALRGRGAYRVHGGGFAGTVQAFVPLQELDRFVQETEAVLGTGSCHILTIRSRGAFVLAEPEE